MGSSIMRFAMVFFMIVAAPGHVYAETLFISVTGNGSVSGPDIGCPDDCTGEYGDDEEVSLRADPDPGWEFTGWSGDIVSTDNPVLITVEDDMNVVALFSERSPTTYTITATAGAGGTISPSGHVSVTQGGGQAFEIIPGAGFQIADVSVDGTSVGAVGSYTFSDVQSDRSIHADFILNPVFYTITATAGTGGTISPSGTVLVSQGGNSTFAIIPYTGYQVSDVMVDGYSAGAVLSYTFPDVSADHSISAVFTQETIIHTITATAGQGGSITPSGEVSVARGGSQSFIITPDSGFTIADVLVDGASVGAVVLYTFADVHDGHTIRASFAESTVGHTIHASAGPGGIINPSGDITVLQGGDRIFTISPESGYHISDVVVDGASVGAVSSYIFQSVSSSHTIHAAFEISTVATYSITASAGTGGGISPSGDVTVAEGDNQKFTITPDTGYQIAQVLVDGTSAGKVGEYTFRDVRADHSIQVTFISVAGPYALKVTASEGGSVTTDPLGETFAPGSEVTLSAAPSTGYAFYRWSGDLTGSANPAGIIMDSDKTINAEFQPDLDVDGESDSEEYGPEGTDPAYDGNHDGTPDSRQANVVSLHTYDGKHYITIEAPENYTLTGTAVNTLPRGAPSSYTYPYGLINFSVSGLEPGGAVRVRVILHQGETITRYFKYKPAEAVWEDFSFDRDSQTGAMVDGNVISLYFVDGGRGDQDGEANGAISDPGTLAVKHQKESWYQKCFISAADGPLEVLSHGCLWMLFLFPLFFSRIRRHEEHTDSPE